MEILVMGYLRTEFAYFGSAFLHTGIGVSFLANFKQGKHCAEQVVRRVGQKHRAPYFLLNS